MVNIANLIDDRGEIRADAYASVLATMYFPTCPDSVAQATWMLMSERQRFAVMGRERYRSSELSKTLFNDISRRLPQIYLAGGMGLSLVFRDKIHGSATQYSAVQVGLELASMVKKGLKVRTLENGRVVEREKRLPKGQTSMETTYRSYESVFHICAAALAADEFNGPLVVENSPEYEHRFLLTAVHFQNQLAAWRAKSDSKFWAIDPRLNFLLKDADLLLSPDTVKAVSFAYAQKYPEPPHGWKGESE